jgi:hypothetical protein
MIQLPSSWYLGSWLVRKKYGVNQCDTLETQLAIAMREARLVLGLGTTVVSQESWMLRPAKGPEQRRMSEKYRAPTLSVEIMITAPTSVAKMGDGCQDIGSVHTKRSVQGCAHISESYQPTGLLDGHGPEFTCRGRTRPKDPIHLYFLFIFRVQIACASRMYSIRYGACHCKTQQMPSRAAKRGD